MWLLTTHRTRAQRLVLLQALLSGNFSMRYTSYAHLWGVLPPGAGQGLADRGTSFLWWFGISCRSGCPHTMVNAR